MAYEARCATGRLESGAALSRFPAHSFDTVVDTFGLCSHEDPVRVGRGYTGRLRLESTLHAHVPKLVWPRPPSLPADSSGIV